jgi:PKD repeat protein
MKLRGFIVILFTFCIKLGYSQLSVPGVPESFSIRTKQEKIIPVKELDTLNTEVLLAEDTKKNINNRYGIVSQMDVDIKKMGVSTFIEGRGTIWQYQVQSINALSLGITFSLFLIPDEAKVFIYDESHTHILGSFTKQNNNKNSFLSIADLPGNNAIIEYFEPINPEFEGQLTLGSVSQAYRDISYSVSSTTATTARIGINCPLGADWQDQKHAVCRMIYQDLTASYYCTGFFVNNTLNDGTPYFMTANHCINSSLNASTLVIYFNYENSTCTSSDASTTRTLSGATIEATNKYSDFTLVIMNDSPPESYNTYFLGWNSVDTYSSTGTCIHHPAGTPKCISVDNGSPVNYAGRISWDNGYISASYTHWQVAFDQGNTEGGSSGSPLMDSNKRVIGQLHGGDDTESFYGKFSLSWNYSSTNASQLKYWLDPSGSGLTAIDGGYMKTKPKSKFISNLQNICINDTIKFTDQSTYAPTHWEWKVSPKSYQFINGTDSLTRNPGIIFNNNGLYTVALITKNSYGSDTLLKTNYIVVVNGVQVAISNVPSDSTICGCKLNSYELSTAGAVNYSYTLERTDKINYTTSAGNIFLSLKSAVSKYGSFNTWLKVNGSIGSCKAKDSALIKVVMPVNDYIENAYRLNLGRSVNFPGKCSSVDYGEPHPSLGDCISGNSWCPNSNASSDSVLNGTLWFTFVGPSSGKINIRTRGSNNRVAVYEADAYTDITSSSSKYTLLAANDNVSATDKTSFIENLLVEHGKTYWLQLDGDTKDPGNYNIELWSGSVEVYPTLNDGNFDLTISSEQAGNADIYIFSEQGKLVYTNKQSISADTNRFNLSLTQLSSGLYIVKVITGGSVLKAKFVIAK